MAPIAGILTRAGNASGEMQIGDEVKHGDRAPDEPDFGAEAIGDANASI
jgi:hypothetical protein